MQPIISLLLPSRGRASLVERLFKSIISTTTFLDKIEVILYLDEDDTSCHSLDNKSINITKIIGKQASMGTYNSTCLSHAKGNIIILINDDLIFKTDGWDEQIIAMDNSFQDKIYLAYPNDLFKNNWCSFPILSRKTCETLIDPYPLEYQGAFIDTHLYDIFKRLKHSGFDRIVYMESVVFEHLHYRAGKSIFDDTYKKRGRFSDDEAFVRLAGLRQKCSNRLIGVITDKALPESSKDSDYCLKQPKGFFASIKYIFKQFLFDRNLPFKWRFFLWYWFIGRYLAAKGMLWPFVKA